MWLHSESRRYTLMGQVEYSYSQNTGQFYAYGSECDDVIKREWCSLKMWCDHHEREREWERQSANLSNICTASEPEARVVWHLKNNPGGACQWTLDAEVGVRAWTATLGTQCDGHDAECVTNWRYFGNWQVMTRKREWPPARKMTCCIVSENAEHISSCVTRITVIV
jgi:hypothetical protein